MEGRHQNCQGRLDGNEGGRKIKEVNWTIKTLIDLLGNIYKLWKVYIGWGDWLTLIFKVSFKKVMHCHIERHKRVYLRQTFQKHSFHKIKCYILVTRFHWNHSSANLRSHSSCMRCYWVPVLQPKHRSVSSFFPRSVYEKEKKTRVSCFSCLSILVSISALLDLSKVIAT